MFTIGKPKALILLVVTLSHTGIAAEPNTLRGSLGPVRSAILPCRTLDLGKYTYTQTPLFSRDGATLFVESRIANEAAKRTDDCPSRRFTDRILAVDVLTGKVVWTLLADCGRKNRLATLTRDGDALIIVCSPPHEFVVINAMSGEVVRRVSFSVSADGADRPRIIGFSSDRRTAFFRQETDEAVGHTEVVGLDLESGEITVRVDIGQPSGREDRRDFLIIPGAESMLLEWTRPKWNQPSHGMTLHDVTPPCEPARTLSVSYAGRPCWVSEDGQVFMVNRTTWDFRTGTETTVLVGGPPGWLRDYPVYDCNFDRIFSLMIDRNAPRGSRFRISVASMRDGAWLADLAFPADVLPGQPHRITVSPTGNTVVASVTKADGPSGKAHGAKFVFWDLSALASPGEEGCTPPGGNASPCMNAPPPGNAVLDGNTWRSRSDFAQS